MDWVITPTVPAEGLKTALTKDEGNIDDSHPLLTHRSFTESFMVYAAANRANPPIAVDGTTSQRL